VGIFDVDALPGQRLDHREEAFRGEILVEEDLVDLSRDSQLRIASSVSSSWLWRFAAASSSA